ncbi:MAG: DUF1786 domain-containing protein [Desulfobacterales bacterium]|nr:DUF1786 domain-containing protein [Desulfobacterales bacterium]
MSRYLLIDIGAGTMDVLYHDEESGIHYKAVVRSPVISLAEKIEAVKGKLLITGVEMGGGPISKVLSRRAREAEVIMSSSSAATIHHNLDRVRSLGIRVIEDHEVDDLLKKEEYGSLTIGDLEVDRLQNIVEGFGVPFDFDVVGICAQDHGVPPDGVSHLDFRHNIFSIGLDENPYPHNLLYKSNELPATFSRLTAISNSAMALPAKEIYIMDSGMAAILGASMDIRARSNEKMLLLDVATSHTLGAALDGDEIAAFFEYHTHDITLKRLESLLVELAEGKLKHEEILAEGGHGAYHRKALGFQNVELILATGPKRGLMKESRLPVVMGAPFGDNMMTGTVGILEAIRRRKGLRSMQYL